MRAARAAEFLHGELFAESSSNASTLSATATASATDSSPVT